MRYTAESEKIPFNDESPEVLAASVAHWILKNGGCKFREMQQAMRDHNATQRAHEQLSEAWTLLIADGYITPAGNVYERGGWQPVYLHYVATHRLSNAIKSGSLSSMMMVQEDVSSMLHPVIRNASINLFRQAKYQDAIMTATQRIEVHLRSVSKLESLTLDDMSGKAFGKGGPLSAVLEEKESHSLMMLFKGMTQLVRNPSHHQELDMNDKAECLRLLGFLSYLFHRLDAIELKLSSPPSYSTP